MNRIVMLGGAVVLLLAIAATQARPENVPLAQIPSESSVLTEVDTASSNTAAPEGTFLENFSTAFQQGTAKVKQSIQNAATSVKDGVMQGYNYMKNKFRGTDGDSPTTPSTMSATTTTVEARVESAKSLDVNAAPKPDTTAKVMLDEPNYDRDVADDRLIFIGDEDVSTDLAPTIQPSTTEKKNLDDRFILDGPVACPKGQTAVNGKCRNTF